MIFDLGQGAYLVVITEGFSEVISWFLTKACSFFYYSTTNKPTFHPPINKESWNNRWMAPFIPNAVDVDVFKK